MILRKEKQDSSRWMEQKPGQPFLMLLVSTFFYNAGVAVIFFLYPLWLFDRGVQERAIGTLSSAMVLGGLAGVIPMARWTRRYGLRNVLFGSLLVSALLLAGRALMPAYSAQLALSFLAGAALSGWIVCVSPALAESVDSRHQASAFNVLFAVAVAAGGLGGIFGGHLPGWLERYGSTALHAYTLAGLQPGRIRQTTVLLGCLLLALAALPMVRLTRGGRAEKMSSFSLRNPWLGRCILAISCWSLAMGLFNPFVSLYFVGQLHVPIARLSVIFLVVQLLQTVGLLVFGGRLQSSLGLVPALFLCQGAAGGVLMLMAYGANAAPIAVLYGFFMVAQRLCDPVFQCVLMNVTSAAERSMATAVCYFALSLTQAISASLGGFALQHYGYPAVLLAAGMTAVIAAFVSVSLFRRIPDNPGGGTLEN